MPTKGSGPQGITRGPDGNLWVTEREANQVAKVSPRGQVLGEYSLPDPNSLPTALVAGPDDHLWMGATPGYLSLVARMSLTGTVTEYQTPTDLSGPLGFAVGPDGNIWFTEAVAGKIGRISEVGYGANCPVQFTDVPAGSPFYAPVRCLACHGMLAGYADGTFRPGAPVTRGQFAKLLGNAAGYAEPARYPTFADVPPTDPFYLYIERDQAHFALHGYACGGPREPCNAQKLAVLPAERLGDAGPGGAGGGERGAVERPAAARPADVPGRAAGEPVVGGGGTGGAARHPARLRGRHVPAGRAGDAGAGGAAARGGVPAGLHAAGRGHAVTVLGGLAGMARPGILYSGGSPPPDAVPGRPGRAPPRQAAAAWGRVMSTRVPSPTRLSSAMCPCCASIRPRAMASPRPVPPVLLPRALSTR